MNESLPKNTKAMASSTPAMPSPSPTPLAPSAALALAEHDRMQNLAAELRCLVCQNQTIADSNSGLAIDLRNQITEQIRAGKTDTAIKQYMVERYGEFVLYKPPFSAGNAALWLGPFLLLLIGIWLTIRVAKKNAAQPQTNTETSTASSQANAERALELEQRYQRDA